MRRLLRTGLLLSAIVLVLLVGGLFLVQSRLDQDAIRLRIERQVLAQTGRRLTIGSVRLQLLPVPTLVAHDVALANRPGAPEPSMLTAPEISGHLAVWPLLHHVARLDGVTLTQPTLVLERDGDGAANWQFHPIDKPSDDHGTPSSGPRWQTRIGSLRVLDGTLSWQDRQHGLTGSAALDRLDASGLAGDAPTIDLAGRNHNAGFTARATIGPLSRLLDNGPDPADWPLHLTARSSRNGREDASLSVDGTIADPLHAHGYALDIDARAEHPDGLNALFPHAAIPPLGPLSLQTRLIDASPASGTPSLARIALHAEHLDVGALVHQDWARGLVLDSVSIDAANPAAPVALSAAGVWHARPLSVHGTAGTLDLWRSRLAGAVTAPVSLVLTAGDAQAHVDGSVGSSRADLAVQAKIPSLHALVEAGPQLDNLSIATKLQLGPGRSLALSGMVLDSKQLGLTGTATLLADARPSLTATLAASHIDLDALRTGWLRPQSASPPSPPSTPAPAAPPADTHAPPASKPIPFALLQQADLDLSLQAATAILDRQTYRDLTARLLVANGVLTLSPFTVTGPAGPIAATLHADAAAHSIAATVLPSMIDAQTLSTWIARPIPLDGAIELVADLHATGADRAAMTADLSGHAGASMVGGSIANGALGHVLGRGGDAAGAEQGRTGFRCLALPARIADGHASLDQIALQTSRLDVQGRGTVRLDDGQLDLHLLPHLSVGVTGASLPVRVGGTLDAPVAALDPAAPGGRFSLTIGGGPSPDLCGPALQAARFGAAGPAAAAASADRPRKLPKPVDILRRLGLFH